MRHEPKKWQIRNLPDRNKTEERMP